MCDEAICFEDWTDIGALAERVVELARGATYVPPLYRRYRASPGRQFHLSDQPQAMRKAAVRDWRNTNGRS
jgi:hypothetical protein